MAFRIAAFFILIQLPLFAYSEFQHVDVEIPTVNGSRFGLFKFLHHLSEPLLIKNAIRRDDARHKWSYNDIVNHPKAVVTFYSTENDHVNLRHMARSGEHEYIQRTMPPFMLGSVTLPEFLYCEEILKESVTLGWMWNLKDRSTTAGTGQDDSSLLKYSVTCMISGNRNYTALYDLSPVLAHALEKEKTKETNDVELQIYKFELQETDCVYIPQNHMFNVYHEKDSMAVIFELNITKWLSIDFSKSKCVEDLADRMARLDIYGETDEEAITLDKISFENSAQTLEKQLPNAWVLSDLIGILADAKTDCISEDSFISAFKKSTLPEVWRKTISTNPQLPKVLFNVLDNDRDGRFCWLDVDELNLYDMLQRMLTIKKHIEDDLGRKYFVKKEDL